MRGAALTQKSPFMSKMKRAIVSRSDGGHKKDLRGVKG